MEKHTCVILVVVLCRGPVLKYLLLELLLTFVVLVLYQIMRRLSMQKNVVGDWIKSLLLPLTVLLAYTWLYYSIWLLPWAHYTALTVGFFYRVPNDEALKLIAQDLKHVSVYGAIGLSALHTGIVFWIAMSVLKKIENDVSIKQQSLSTEFNTAIDSVFMFLRGAIYVYFVFVVMRLLNLDYLADSLFTTGAVGAIAISFAARDSIANIFGGCMILFDRPFRIGDYITSPDRNIEGVVERIGWRVTLVRTPSKSVKYIPNSLFTTLTIENSTRRTHRRLNFTVGVRYGDFNKIRSICDDIEALMEKVEYIDKRLANYCTLNALGDFSINLLLNVYIKPMSMREFNKCREDFLFGVVEVVKKHDADFPFPTTTLDVPERFSASQQVSEKNAD